MEKTSVLEPAIEHILEIVDPSLSSVFLFKYVKHGILTDLVLCVSIQALILLRLQS